MADIDEMRRAIEDLCKEANRTLTAKIKSGEITRDDVWIHPETERNIQKALYNEWVWLAGDLRPR